MGETLPWVSASLEPGFEVVGKGRGWLWNVEEKSELNCVAFRDGLEK